MANNHNINKDSLLVLLFVKRKLANHEAYHISWSQEIIPTSRISLRVHCVLRVYLPLLQMIHEKYLCVEDSSGGLRRILVLIARCLF